jgi:hypothetical protein
MDMGSAEHLRGQILFGTAGKVARQILTTIVRVHMSNSKVGQMRISSLIQDDIFYILT